MCSVLCSLHPAPLPPSGICTFPSRLGPKGQDLAPFTTVVNSHLAPFHPERLPGCLSCSSPSWYLLEACRKVSAAGLGPMERNRPLQPLSGEMDGMEAFPGVLVAQVTSAPFPFSRPSCWSPPSSGLAMPAPGLPQLLLRPRADQVLPVVKGHMPAAPEGPHPALPGQQGGCHG